MYDDQIEIIIYFIICFSNLCSHRLKLKNENSHATFKNSIHINLKKNLIHVIKERNTKTLVSLAFKFQIMQIIFNFYECNLRVELNDLFLKSF